VECTNLPRLINIRSENGPAREDNGKKGLAISGVQYHFHKKIQYLSLL